VSTSPEYRNRGLVRAQFEVVHQWASECRTAVTAISGIPYFYRQFGYEMCVAIWTGRAGRPSLVPTLPKGQSETYDSRPAVASDIPVLRALSARGALRGVLSCVRDDATWLYELNGRDAHSLYFRHHRVITDAEGRIFGWFTHEPGLSGPRGDAAMLLDLEVADGVPWAGIGQYVLRWLAAHGRSAEQASPDHSFEKVTCLLGLDHPIYLVAGGALPEQIPPYAWYLRVPDLCSFLWTIAPALERRLAASQMAGHTGQLSLNNYRDGLHIEFERGRVKSVRTWKPTQANWGNAKFPDLTFLQLLFGHRSVTDIEYAIADAGIRDDVTRCLLDALFPRRSSWIWGLG
jgi:hypothetical protein